MQRRDFLRASSLVALSLSPMLAKALGTQVDLNELPQTPKMPVLFVGHGSPMNAIENNAFRQTWQKIGKELPKPKAILMVSAHWLSDGNTAIMATQKPETIHDFGGFSEELFAQQYPANGSPQVAQLAAELLKQPLADGSHVKTAFDLRQGYDHGTWSVLLPMFPQANIPVFQISIDYFKPAAYHYALGKQLAALRERGVLIMGSGNIVHNLKAEALDSGKPYAWNQAVDQKIAHLLQKHDDQALIQFADKDKLIKLAHPTVDHLWPLFYALGAKREDDQVRFFNAAYSGSAISMRSVIFS